MNLTLLAAPSPSSRADRMGMYASVLCAIHCAITPFLLILAPAFGGLWSHPLSHWIAAAFVVPLASVMIRKGYRRHRKRWVLVMGTLGIGLILFGAVLPHLVTSAPETPWHSAACAVDACCPSLVVDEEGVSRLHIPLAAGVTTFGGFALILTHLGNLRSGCACHGRGDSELSAKVI
jgi:hypothetical protein